MYPYQCIFPYLKTRTSGSYLFFPLFYSSASDIDAELHIAGRVLLNVWRLLRGEVTLTGYVLILPIFVIKWILFQCRYFYFFLAMPSKIYFIMF